MVSEQINKEVKVSVDPKRLRKSDRAHLKSDNTKIKNFTNWTPKKDVKAAIELLISDPNMNYTD